MGISDPLARTPEFHAFASQFGLSDAQAASAADALLPAMLGGVKKQMSGGGLGGLLGLLGGGLMGGNDDAAAFDTQRGNQALGQIFGSKDVSRAVAQNASQQTGLDESLLKKMLPVLASMLMAYVARQGGGESQQGSSQGGLGALVGGLLGGGASQQGAGGLSGLLSMLDANGDGNPLDDILRMAGKSVR